MCKAITKLALVVTLIPFLMSTGSTSVTAVENPCKGEIERLCRDVKLGTGGLKECLMQHKDEISPECRDFVTPKGEALKSKVEHVEAACGADVKRLCKGIEPGEGRIQRCLTEHKDEISQECKDSLREQGEALQSKWEKVETACSADAKRLCKDVEPGEGRILVCLMQHPKEISQTCKDAIVGKGEASEKQLE